MRRLIPIPKKRVGRPPRVPINWTKVRELVIRQASIRQVEEMTGLSHGSAQRAVRFIRDQMEAG